MSSPLVALTMTSAHTVSRGGRVVADIPQVDCEAQAQTPMSGFCLFWLLRSGRQTSLRVTAAEYQDLFDRGVLIARLAPAPTDAPQDAPIAM